MLNKITSFRLIMSIGHVFMNEGEEFMMSKLARVFFPMLLVMVVAGFALFATTGYGAEKSKTFITQNLRDTQTSSVVTSSLPCRLDDLFVMTAYSPKAPDSKSVSGGHMDELANNHFTLLGLTYQQQSNKNFLAEEIRTATEHDLCLIYPIGPRRTTTDNNGEEGTRVELANDEVADASDEQLDLWVSDVKSQIEEAVADPVLNKRIAAWYIFPEEMRYWESQELKLLERMYNAVKMHDPLQRPAWMYEPQHALSSRLTNTIPYQDIVSVGIYPHISGNDHNRIQVRHTMTQMTEAISQTGSDKPAIPVLEMFESTDKPYSQADIPLIPTFVRHDAYAAIANGAQGLIIFSMGRRAGFNTYTDYYKAWEDVSNETYSSGLRDVIKQGNLLNKIEGTVTSGESTMNFEHPVTHEIYTYPSVSVRGWSYNNKTYVLVVNSSDSKNGVGFSLSNLPPDTYTDQFTGMTYDITNGTLDLTLPRYGVMLLVNEQKIYLPLVIR